MDNPNKPSKLTTVAPDKKALPAGFGSQPKSSGMEESSKRSGGPKGGGTVKSSSPAGINPDRQTMASNQRLNSGSAGQVQRMSGKPTASHALSGSLKRGKTVSGS